MQIYVAHLETRNYEFTAYGHNQTEALAMLKRAFVRHIDNHRGSLAWLDVREDAWVEKIELGTAVVR
jgi:hypothetical protein